ncbi:MULTISPECIES: MotA/TolQ/ExbB proton channel family protein [unclassified Oceanobacter]|jgi:biopolymer transport protein ExbB|uniref:MotA/TolQ/ExbB proton channel family protein n=1 Tax=unclassified Oceanobacter TaxID=2620260 RepID=UPI0026E23E79|nr:MULTISPECIES: MotA/TolQ/ExbB proton channel family protein [unclassified Oceanobacter]MDO6681367.1 MotA/TolQ/ExbB proton channel family protein [Oceanobacter sp. 5_MG-2023]MDP2505076.1 MotA/TolQ/ExbB proton channel family protein [Oceanobacter sp. 3_MG-2023]MDP2548200.1 MotA/TolQ/ExbB proton channel family protein [Oceanobacter sp. 4_MG-2023]
MEEISLFLERGGEVIYPIMAVIFLLWAYLIERTLYVVAVHPARCAIAQQEWCSRSCKHSWISRQIHQELLASLTMGLDAGFTTIRMFIVICPLLGLLGTVTGMIEVFDVMVQLGAGSPKPMAAGISKAILSTVAGMVGAITGLLAQTVLRRIIEHEKRRIKTVLAFD